MSYRAKAEDAGLTVMAEVLDIAYEQMTGRISREEIDQLSVADIGDLYVRFIVPAIAQLQEQLCKDYHDGFRWLEKRPE